MPVSSDRNAMRLLEVDPLRLVPQTAAHAPALFAVLCDPALYLHENAPPPSVEWLSERFRKLESRHSSDGSEQWLNWVVDLRGQGPIGYVQATVQADGCAAIAYVLGSAHWGRGLASLAVRAMCAELEHRHGAQRLSALLKRGNLRSLRLLERMGFELGSIAEHEAAGAAADEWLLLRGLPLARLAPRPPEAAEPNAGPREP